VLAFHGGGGNAESLERYSGLDRVADREGFVVLYPEGTGRMEDKLLTFNAGTCCGYAAANRIDDVGFARGAIADLGARMAIDLHRVYATGHSNGGMMSYRMALEAPDLVAAVVPVSGAISMPAARLGSGPPVPVLHIHSVDDPRALYNGGLGPPFPFTNVKVLHQPVPDALRYWSNRNQCRGEPAEKRRIVGTGSNRGQSAELLDYGPCQGGAPVWHWRLHGVGHGWPGDGGRGMERILGPRTTIIDAAGEGWAFMRQFSR
jgi:polyhydroxybutyrate depolymerase